MKFRWNPSVGSGKIYGKREINVPMKPVNSLPREFLKVPAHYESVMPVMATAVFIITVSKIVAFFEAKGSMSRSCHAEIGCKQCCCGDNNDKQRFNDKLVDHNHSFSMMPYGMWLYMFDHEAEK